MSKRSPRRAADRSELEFVLDVLRVDPGEKHTVRTLSTKYGGCFTHWHRGRGHYCPGREDCQLHKLDRIWKGYAAVEEWDAPRSLWFPCVLEITEGLELDLRDQWDRGQVWEISRKPKVEGGKATPVVGRLLETRNPDTFPHPFEFRSVLMRVYHVTEIHLDQVNPFPARQIVKASQGQAPVDPAQPAKKEDKPTPEQFQAIRDRARGIGGMPSSNGKEHAKN